MTAMPIRPLSIAHLPLTLIAIGLFSGWSINDPVIAQDSPSATAATKPQPQEAQMPERIRVLTYNIHHAEGIDGRLDVARIAKVITECKADLVALQEVDQNTDRTNQVDQPAELGRLTGLHVAFGPNLDFGGGHYGNAVLSRWPVVLSNNHLLPNTGGGEQRGLLDVTIKVDDNSESIRLLATHFDHRRPDAQRLDSAAAVNALLKDKESHSLVLLAGDLNDVPTSATLQRLKTHWTVANEKPLPTIPVTEPNRQIDFVLFRPTENWQVDQVTVLPEAVASDHRGLLVEFVLRR